MTIAAGILCSDGMILCADTEEMITDERKGRSSKIQVYHESSRDLSSGDQTFHWAAGIAGAGHADWVSAFIKGMTKSVFPKIDGRFTSLDHIEEELDKYTERFFLKYIRSYAEDPSNRPQAQILVLIQLSTHELTRDIYRVNENVVLPLTATDIAAVGKGAPVFERLAEELIKPSCTMRQAASIVIYIMDKVKSEVPGCGGNSQIVMIRGDGQTETIPTRRIRELEIEQTSVEMKLHDSLAEELIKMTL